MQQRRRQRAVEQQQQRLECAKQQAYDAGLDEKDGSVIDQLVKARELRVEQFLATFEAHHPWSPHN